ncbi:MAG: aldo/keto reductase, partial [Alphaproteobacteria bacterium]|nr:aldo/keto reductase [Alphaproteobacteria bacterium]
MLETVLAGVSTSRIGFGCGRLVGGAAMKQSRVLVETALNLGIRHFDTAPSYGLGSSEDVLGAVLEGQSDVTIVTKVGQARPSAPGLKAFARQALRPLLMRAPALRARLAKATAPGSAPSYSPGAIAASLADSLTRLRRSCVTATLLHEIDAQSLTPDVVRAMHEQRDLGRTLALGSGTGAGLDGLVPFGTISQYRWQPDVADCPAGDVILHGALRQFPQPDRFSASQIDGLRAL